MTNPAASSLLLTATERVHMGKRVSDALSEEAALLGARRIFLLVSSSLRGNTDEIARIEEALGDRVAGAAQRRSRR